MQNSLQQAAQTIHPAIHIPTPTPLAKPVPMPVPAPVQTEDLLAKLQDIYDITYNPWWLQTWFFLLVIFTVFLLVSFFVYRWYSRRKTPVLTYDQRILHELDLLEKKLDTGYFSVLNSTDSANTITYPDNITAGNSPAQFYLELTALVKQYIEARFSILVCAQTDAEFLDRVKNSSVIPIFVQQDIEQIFAGVTLIKFARAQTVQEHMTQAIGLSKLIILKTNSSEKVTNK